MLGIQDRFTVFSIVITNNEQIVRYLQLQFSGFIHFNVNTPYTLYILLLLLINLYIITI